MTYLLFGEPRTDANNVDHITLHDTYVRELAATKCIKLLALPLPLFLLLRQALMAEEDRVCQAGSNDIISDPDGHGTVEDTYSSLLMGLNWTASSVYSRLQAGQRPFRFSLM